MSSICQKKNSNVIHRFRALFISKALHWLPIYSQSNVPMLVHDMPGSSWLHPLLLSLSPLSPPCFPITPTAPGLHHTHSLTSICTSARAIPSTWKACPHLVHLVHLFSTYTFKPIPAPPKAELGAPTLGLLSNLHTPCPRPGHTGSEGPACIFIYLRPTRLWATCGHVPCLIHPLILLAQSLAWSWMDEHYLILTLGNKSIVG